MKLLSTNQVSEIVGRKPITLRRWTKLGSFPKPIIHNKRAVGWYEKDIENWLTNGGNR